MGNQKKLRRYCLAMMELNWIKRIAGREHYHRKDLVNTGFRKQQLDIFTGYCYEGYLPDYKEEVLGRSMHQR